MTHSEPDESKRYSTSHRDRLLVQFGVRDVLVLMLFTALALGAWTVGREWLPIIVIAFWYYVSRFVRWRGSPISESTKPPPHGRPATVSMLMRVVAVLSGTMNGAVIGALFFIVLASTTAATIRFIPLVGIGAALGLLLAITFPRFFSRFWLPWPF